MLPLYETLEEHIITWSNLLHLPASSGMPEINEIRTLLGTGDDISHLFAQGEHPAQKDHPRHCSSLVHIPTFLMTGSTMPSQEVANSRRDGRAASPNSSVPTAKSVLEPGTAKIDVDPTDNGGSETGGSETDGTLGVPDAADDERPSDAKHSNGACPHPAIASHRSAPDKIMNGITLDNMEGESQENEYDKEKESSLTPIEVKLKRKVSSLFKKKPEKSILKKRPENDLAVMSHLLEKHPMNLRHLKVPGVVQFSIRATRLRSCSLSFEGAPSEHDVPRSHAQH